MKTLILSTLILLISTSANAYNPVPYSKTRYEGKRECLYFYSGKQNGGEDLVSVQCFDAT